MPQTLRKACHACTKAKRRCIPQLPRCERCIAKNLTCEYDLEPVTSTEERREKPIDGPRGTQRPRIFGSVEEARHAAMQISYTESGPSSELPAMADNGTGSWFVSKLIASFGLMREGKSTPFLHANVSKIKDRAPSPSLPLLSSSHLILDIHHLIQQLVSRLFLSPLKPSETEATSMFGSLATLTERLWSSLPLTVSPDEPPWEAWTVAESARRTLLFAQFARALYGIGTKGYVIYQPFVESLPFDPRAGLWEAKSEEEWRRAVERHGGKEEWVCSWHEFTMAVREQIPEDWEGEFQEILFVTGKGGRV